MSIFDDDIIDKIPDSFIESQLPEYLMGYNFRPLTHCKVKKGIIYYGNQWNEYVFIKKRFPKYFKFDDSWNKAMNIIYKDYGDITSQDDIKDIKGTIIDVYTKISNCTLNVSNSITFKNKFKNIKISAKRDYKVNVYLNSIESPEELLEISSDDNYLQCVIPFEVYGEIEFNSVKYKDMIKILYKNKIECIVNPNGASFYLDTFLMRCTNN